MAAVAWRKGEAKEAKQKHMGVSSSLPHSRGDRRRAGVRTGLHLKTHSVPTRPIKRRYHHRNRTAASTLHPLPTNNAPLLLPPVNAPALLNSESAEEKRQMVINGMGANNSVSGISVLYSIRELTRWRGVLADGGNMDRDVLMHILLLFPPSNSSPFFPPPFFLFSLNQEHGPMSSGQRKILLVEDTEINRMVVRRLVRELNLEMEEAENGQAAVEYFMRGNNCDLILMDKDMPIMDGHEATRQLRSLGVRTPIIALSGNNLQSDRDHFLQAGADEFQTKPLSKEQLVRILARYGLGSSPQ